MKTQHGRDISGQEMACMLDEFCNKANVSDVKKFVEQVTERTHRTLQQRIMNLFMRTVEKWAELPPGWYDLRNEATVRLAKKIVEATDKYDRHLPLI